MHVSVLAGFLDPASASDPSSVLSIATKIDTPLMLAGLVVLVLFLLFGKSLPDSQAKMVFILALVAEVLGIAAYVYVYIISHRQPPPQPKSFTVEGIVVSPADSRNGVPKAQAFILVKGHPFRTTTTDENGYYSFVIQPEDESQNASLYIRAKGYKESDEKSVTLARDMDRVNFGLEVNPAQSAQTTSTVRPPTLNVDQPMTAVAQTIPDPTCLNGKWREHLVGTPDTNQMFTWSFVVNGDSLVGTRDDNFAVLKLQRFNNDWRGNLVWGSGDVWKNVDLTPTADCKVIDTNQGWIYGR